MPNKSNFIKIPVFFFLLIIIAVFFPRCSRAPVPSNESKKILMIVIDALRPDHLGVYGYSRKTSSNIDRMAQEGIVFDSAFSVAGWTKPSIATLITSLYPSEHGVRKRARKKNNKFFVPQLGDNFLTLAEVFKGEGFQTFAVVSNPYLSMDRGFGQGYEKYIEGRKNAKEIFQIFGEWVSLKKPQKFFGYLHFMDVHWPYSPIPPYDTMFGPLNSDIDFSSLDWKTFRNDLRDGSWKLNENDLDTLKALYDGQIRYFDDVFGDFILKMGKEIDSWTIVILADHGEEFNEHGGMGHGPFLYDVNIRIPMIFRFPGYSKKKEMHVLRPVSMLDVMPTILKSAGIAPPPGISGKSLFPEIDMDQEGRDHYVFSEESFEDLYSRYSIRSSKFKLIQTVIMEKAGKNDASIQFEFFDLDRDPGEKFNIFSQKTDIALAMNQILEKRLSEISTVRTQEFPIDPETVERLRALGYLQ